MLEQLMGLIKENSQEAIVNNPVIPNEHNDSAMQTILSSVVGGLASQGESGNSSGIWGLLSGKNANLASNPIVSGIATQAVGSLMEKFGINKSAAGGIVSAVLPSVIGQLVSKTNDPNDSSFDLNSIMGAVMGNNNQQQNTGGGLMDVLGGVLNNSQQQQAPQQQGGGLMDMLNVFIQSQQK
ncbi:MAG: DUF937 domain-containing protein [Bacteroidota bacterium]